MASKPVVGNKKRGNNAVYISAERLAAYIFKITESTKRFPAIYRPTIVNEMRNSSLKLLEELSIAMAMHPKYKKQYNTMKKHQDKAVANLSRLTALVIFVLYYMNLSNPEELMRLIDDCKTALTRWINYMRGRYHNLPSKKVYYRNQQFKKMHFTINRNLKTIKERDEDGFIMLKHK